MRPIGAQTSVREAVFFGVSLVCADVGTDASAEAARRMVMISFCIDSTRNKAAFKRITAAKSIGPAAKSLAENCPTQAISRGLTLTRNSHKESDSLSAASYHPKNNAGKPK